MRVCAGRRIAARLLFSWHYEHLCGVSTGKTVVAINLLKATVYTKTGIKEDASSNKKTHKFIKNP